MKQPVLQIDKISQSYGPQMVIRELSLQLDKGEIGCLLGVSGCGKTTVLRTIAGFERLLDGEIRLNERLVSSPLLHLPPAKRGIGMVFQDYALFPHLSVAQNIAFGLRGVERELKPLRVQEMLKLVGLEKERDRYPHEISGGQQQRVALARALAPQPELLLLDEPFSNLDVTLRERLSMEVRDILKANGATALFVTHNQHEAFAVADRIGVMDSGRLRQWGTAFDLYHAPSDPFVACFVGEGTLLPGTVRKDGGVETALGILRGDFSPGLAEGRAVRVLIRPEEIACNSHDSVSAEIVRRSFRGGDILYLLRLPNEDLVQALVPSHLSYDVGDLIDIHPKVRDLVVFPVKE
ncbi:MAG: ABC transporter ATP-binding protein [Syntrophotaleaceae bacterium]